MPLETLRKKKPTKKPVFKTHTRSCTVREIEIVQHKKVKNEKYWPKWQVFHAFFFVWQIYRNTHNSRPKPKCKHRENPADTRTKTKKWRFDFGKEKTKFGLINNKRSYEILDSWPLYTSFAYIEHTVIQSRKKWTIGLGIIFGFIETYLNTPN